MPRYATRLESDAGVQLDDASRSVRAQEVAVRAGGDVHRAHNRAEGGRRHIRIRYIEIRMVEHIEEVRSHAKMQRFGQLKVLLHRNVCIEIMRAAELVPSLVADGRRPR